MIKVEHFKEIEKLLPLYQEADRAVVGLSTSEKTEFSATMRDRRNRRTHVSISEVSAADLLPIFVKRRAELGEKLAGFNVVVTPTEATAAAAAKIHDSDVDEEEEDEDF